MSRDVMQQALDALTYQGTMGPTRRQRRYAAITALQAALAQSEPDLTPYGYAPGGYMLTCKTCGKTSDGADKRAYHCKECATRLAQHERKGLFLDLIATHEGLAEELKAMDAPDWRPMTTTPFEDWYYDECSIDAAEVVGPNSREYEGLIESYLDDTTRREAALVRYRLETGDLSEN